MTASFPPPFQVSTAAQAQALLDFTSGVRLLEQFMDPATPSQAARALAEPANRVTSHVRKLTAAGLLRVARRHGTRVHDQVAAHTFHVPRVLVPLS
ncbi:helix-turn-helix domain-containing protein [Deinococcus sonorensis]|uniref:Helix-turn-helix domain-containing protein n=2 Tax=Deinococcus sonorensis TaxID=309891 RepID=A0AAU7U797_9DEIO